jgi:uncharacterized protein YnzC (UPF0291/DUF896 family)
MRSITVRVGDAEANHINEQAIKSGLTKTEIIRQAIWRDAAVAEIRDQTRAAVQKEFDLLFAKLAVEFSGEVEKLSIEVETMRQELRQEFSSATASMREEVLKSVQETRDANKENLKIIGQALLDEISKRK